MKNIYLLKNLVFHWFSVCISVKKYLFAEKSCISLIFRVEKYLFAVYYDIIDEKLQFTSFYGIDCILYFAL